MEIKFRAAPAYRQKLSTIAIMNYLYAGLMVVYAFALYRTYTQGMPYFINAIAMFVASQAVAFATEAVYAISTKQKVVPFIKTSFPWITSIIVVLTVSTDTSVYACAVATFIAIFFGKLVFGGFGQNIFNPAGVGRAVIGVSLGASKIADVISGATPTTAMASSGWLMSAEGFKTLVNGYGGLSNLFIGMYNGAIGETSVLIILLVGAFLTYKEVIDWRVPAVYVGVLFFGSLLFSGFSLFYALAFIFTGGIFFGAVFMLTDPVTSPTTRPGKIVFASFCALLTALIRIFGNLPEGVVFSILLGNMITPAIDRFFEGKQTDDEKRNLIAAVCAVVVSILIIGLCRFGMTENLISLVKGGLL